MKNQKEVKFKTRLIPVYDSSATVHIPFGVDENNCIGIRFKIDSKSVLKSLTAHCPSYSDNIGTLPMHFYKWDETYEKTVSSAPIYTVSPVDFPDSAFVNEDVSAGNISDGEYLFLAKDGKDGVGFWCNAPYADGSAEKDEFGFTIYTNGTEGGEIIPKIIFEIESECDEKVYPESEYSGADYIRAGWMIKNIPSYDYGKLSENVYNCGQGIFIPDEFDADDDSEMICISETNIKEYKNYIRKLSENGYVNEMHNEISSNVYDMYFDGKNRIYCYYTEAYNEVRVILDKTSQSISKFNYSYEKKNGESTEIYQYGLCMAKFWIPPLPYLEYIDCGMSYVIKLADNSIFVIDGGMFTQYDKAHSEKFLAFLKDITKVKPGEKIRVSCWAVTHAHDDHNSGFSYFTNMYHDDFEIERVLFNYPDEHNENKSLLGTVEYNHGSFIWLRKYWPDVVEMKCHTGQRFKLANAEIEVLVSHEDVVDAKTGKSYAGELNSTTSVFKLYIDGVVILMPGDMTSQQEKVAVETFEANVFKCDILQAPHHFFNNLYTFYRLCDSPVILGPQAKEYTEVQPYMGAFVKFVETVCDKLHYGGNETVGYRLDNGKAEEFFHDVIVGGRYTDWPFFE